MTHSSFQILVEEIICSVKYVMAGLSSLIGIKSGRNLQPKVKSTFITHPGSCYEPFPEAIRFLWVSRKRYISVSHQMLREFLKNG